MSNEACQVNFDKMNIKTCLQNKKLPEEITFLREQINEKKTIIFRSLFSLKLSNREEDNFPQKVKKNNSKKMSETFDNVLIMY